MDDTHVAIDRMEECAHVCHECEDACLKIIPHCLERGRECAAPEHIGLLLDCIAICGASHDLLHRGSPMHVETCRACAAICAACERSCAGMGAEEDECARMCRKCAESCRKMAG